MLRDFINKYYIDSNYNCAEAMIRGANDYYKLNIEEKDFKLMSGFGAGMQVGQMCGAVSCGVAVLSMLYVENKAHESVNIRPVSTLFMRKVFMHYGSFLCKDIKPQSFKKEIRCQLTIETICDFLEETINEYDKKVGLKHDHC